MLQHPAPIRSAADPNRTPGAVLMESLAATGVAVGRQQAESLALKLLDRAEEAWPALATDQPGFLEHVAACVRGDEPIGETLDRISVEDLYLAHACARQCPRALARLAEICDHELGSLFAALRFPAGDREDARQGLWCKLVLSVDGSPPKILSYRGHGRLRGWLRVLAGRFLADTLRRTGPAPFPLTIANADFRDLGAAERDPELLRLKRVYRHNFRDALEHSIAELTPQQRNALRSHYLLGMTLDQMATAFGCHRATVARHLARARDTLLEGTRERLRAQLEMSDTELDSVMRLIESNLSASLGRMLE